MLLSSVPIVTNTDPRIWVYIRNNYPRWSVKRSRSFVVTEGEACRPAHTASSEKVIADTLAARHAMPSWKACELEGTSWTGTVEKNIEK
jgi:hypothetical protein